MPTGAAPPLPCIAGEPPETPFSTKKRNSAGGNLKNAKGFSGGARSSFAGTGGGASALRAKMGSSGFVKSHQNRIQKTTLTSRGWFRCSEAITASEKDS